jgi:hypothetical protein
MIEVDWVLLVPLVKLAKQISGLEMLMLVSCEVVFCMCTARDKLKV